MIGTKIIFLANVRNEFGKFPSLVNIFFFWIDLEDIDEDAKDNKFGNILTNKFIGNFLDKKVEQICSQCRSG